VKRFLNDILWLLPVPLGLILVHQYALDAPDAVLGAIVLTLALLMAAGLWLRALVRRRLFLAGALRVESFWHRRLRGGLGLALAALTLALPLTVILLVAAVRPSSDYFLFALVINVPVQALLWQGAYRLLNGHAVARFHPVLALRAALSLNFVLLFGGLAIAALFQSYPDFGGLTLAQALLSEVGRQDAESELLAGLLQMAAAKDALAWWLGQQLLPGIPGSTFVEIVLVLGAWVLLLATDALAVWSYLVVCSAVLTLVHWRDWHPGAG
jgi:hypothetical protein